MQSVLGSERSKLYANPSFSEESIQRGRAFQPQSSDIIVATAPKTGTTWLQWILVLLRSGGGDPDFEDIYQVSPWIDFAWDLDLALEMAPGIPRVYKSHERLAAVQRGCKYIVTVRQPGKTVGSWWRFLAAKGAPVTQLHRSPSSMVYNEEYWARNMRFGASLMEYYLEYWQCRQCEDVLVLCFEDLQKDLAAHLPVIAAFVGIEADEELLRLVASKSSKEFMMLHESKIDESWTHRQVHRVQRNPNPDSWSPASRVTLGCNAGLDATAEAALQEQWVAGVTAAGGPASYPELVTDVRTSLAERFGVLYQFTDETPKGGLARTVSYEVRQ